MKHRALWIVAVSAMVVAEALPPGTTDRVSGISTLKTISSKWNATPVTSREEAAQNV